MVFLVGYHWEAIKEFFGDGTAHGFHAHYSIEETPLGRGGAIRRGLALVPEDEPWVFVTNGDIITGDSLNKIRDAFLKNRKKNASHQATILVAPFFSPFGLVDIQGEDYVKGFREKVELPYWINGGIYVFSRDIEDRLPELGDHETSTFPALAAEGKMCASRSGAFWRSVDSFKDLQEAETYLSNVS